mmetsp:Transcript_34204/g.90868  ORF Transcript_34204/g.90868 Transcript_34204/m.90868 type:complete len:224 (+) Transcript_34204:3-674(+)
MIVTAGAHQDIGGVEAHVRDMRGVPEVQAEVAVCGMRRKAVQDDALIVISRCDVVAAVGRGRRRLAHGSQVREVIVCLPATNGRPTEDASPLWPSGVPRHGQGVHALAAASLPDQDLCVLGVGHDILPISGEHQVRRARRVPFQRLVRNELGWVRLGVDPFFSACACYSQQVDTLIPASTSEVATAILLRRREFHVAQPLKLPFGVLLVADALAGGALQRREE